MDRAVPASFWRGGTSRAVLFGSDDLAGYRPEQVEAIILAALGSPDPDGRQIDGLGGGISSLSKAAIVGPAPAGSGADVAFRFAQVEATEPRVDLVGNCGNISAAIAPFAVGVGLVPAGGAARRDGTPRHPGDTPRHPATPLVIRATPLVIPATPLVIPAKSLPRTRSGAGIHCPAARRTGVLSRLSC